MRLLAAIVLVCASACAHTATTPPAEPASPIEAVRSRIADYVSRADTIYVREMNGALQAVIHRTPQRLTHVAGDTFVVENSRIVLGEQSAIFEGRVVPRRVTAVGTFHITVRRPVADLRQEALKATPPPQPDSLLKPGLVELQSLAPTIKYDIRYATTNNFMGAVMYPSANAFMQRPAAEAVARAHKKLNVLGYGLLIHDAYRPWYVTKMFWEGTPDSLRNFVADPAEGSRHNRGAAVDLSMYDLTTGQPVQMPGGYDEFSERSFPTYPGGTTAQRWRRDLLRRIMEDEGFHVNSDEWWHFDYHDWRRYPVTNLTFEQLGAEKKID